MPDSESRLLVPLRSNASTLLTGSPIAAMRRRLKTASLFFDRLILEEGVYRFTAGPGGMFNVTEHPPDDAVPGWETPTHRHAAQSRPFAVAFGREPALGVAPPAELMRTAIHSETTSMAWVATLQPFARELPADADWIDFDTTSDPQGEPSRVARRWSSEDQGNPALERAIPERFARHAVIEHANRDLVVGASNAVSVSIDSLHTQVAAQRFRDGTWGMSGYAVPILYSHVGDLPWETIADIRRDRDWARFRAVLRAVEEEVAADATTSDIEAAVNRVYRKYLRGYPDTIPSIGDIAHRTLTGFAVGGTAGVAVSGITGPLGALAGAAIGSGTTTIIDIYQVIKGRRARGWISLDHHLDALRPRQ